ncbi:MAG: hypothetical protein ABR981_02045 [Candidatus Micrarchaeaceae archaeon]|jgi:hypothetical protein
MVSAEATNTTKSHFSPKSMLRRASLATYGTVLALGIIGNTALAQSNQMDIIKPSVDCSLSSMYSQDQTEGITLAEGKKRELKKFTGFVYDIANMADGIPSNATLTELFINFKEGKTATVVIGDTYDARGALNAQDIGIRYDNGSDLYRFTILSNKNIQVNRFDISAGFDAEKYITSHLTLLGNIAHFEYDGSSWINYSFGPQIKFSEKSSIFFIYSDIKNTNNYRFGYVWHSKDDKLVSIFTDYRQAKLGSLPNTDINGDFSFKHSTWQVTYNTLGLVETSEAIGINNKLPFYPREVLPLQQGTFTTRYEAQQNAWIGDADTEWNTTLPATVFLNANGKFGGVIKFAFAAKGNGIKNGFADGAFMITSSSTQDGISSGPVFTAGYYDKYYPNILATYSKVGFGWKWKSTAATFEGYPKGGGAGIAVFFNF